MRGGGRAAEPAMTALNAFAGGKAPFLGFPTGAAGLECGLGRTAGLAGRPRARTFSSAAPESTDASKPPPARETAFQRYKALFRAQPASHLTAFLVLHEITAVLPLPLLYYALHRSEVAWDAVFPRDWLEKGDRRMRGTFKALGLPEIEGSRAALNAAAAYGIVKAAMPLRLAACAYLTPWFARTFVAPIGRLLSFGRGRMPPT
ncbi:hypothetical protein DFJ74DRAFT_492888 [Hyaloraphidium curvatum]|nr:hypothetical protein DFJ74DRAFT_492888 [Hyaloraphidium curvatum]